MRKPIQVIIAGLFCIAAAAGVVVWIINADAKTGARPRPAVAGGSESGKNPADEGDPRRNKKEPFIDIRSFEDGGLGIAQQFTGTVRDPKSLKDLREAIGARGRVGRSVLKAQLDPLLPIDAATPKPRVGQAIQLEKAIGLLSMHDGLFEDADAAFAKALEMGKSGGIPSQDRTDLIALRGIVAMRRGEIANCIGCVGPSSCIFPITTEATHKEKLGSREAIKHFTAYLDELPGDLRIQWILNLAYMTLGEYPDKVPKKFLIPLDTFRSKLDDGRFENIAPLVGLTVRGPNMAGGSVFDDFNGDGLPDLFTTSLDIDRGASFYVNKGDGTFEERSDAAGLADQVYALNITRADIDNDGDLDVLLLRGAWEKPMRMSLLKNKGDGTFEDITLAAGMIEPISSEAACWGDFDNDGFADVFVCGEYLPPFSTPPNFQPDARNRCRLYRNKGDGTFEDVAASAGVQFEQCAKGCGWGDYDDDGKLDLYVSNMSGPSRLYHNDGGGKFTDVASQLGVAGADGSFACWFWDYDNDGKLDIYVNDKGLPLAMDVAMSLGLPNGRTDRPRLYRNLGKDGFQEVTQEVGLEQARPPMGCNFGDIDNDGYLDIYLGTGAMDFTYLIPNQMFKNVAGKKFEDVTMSSGTGHLQKGHGVSFADWDCDGDLDLFVEAGGAVPGDRSFNLLFQNPGHKRHWLKVKLVGTKTNRAALGAKIRAVVKSPDGSSRTLHRTVGNNSSFGGNSLVEMLGLSDSASVSELTITWPGSGQTQTFRDVAADRLIEITEGSDQIKPISQKVISISR